MQVLKKEIELILNNLFIFVLRPISILRVNIVFFKSKKNCKVTEPNKKSSRSATRIYEFTLRNAEWNGLRKDYSKKHGKCRHEYTTV